MTLRTNGSNISTMTTDTRSANTRVAADARTGNGNFKVVHLGKDQRPISVMKLAMLKELDWRRGAIFNHLSKAIKGQMCLWRHLAACLPLIRFLQVQLLGNSTSNTHPFQRPLPLHP